MGEARPYCAAVLWTDRTLEAATNAIERELPRINEGLSHPEQVKRWVVLHDELSIERGDLTPNLKLRRNRVAARLGHVIDALYEREEARA